MAHPYQPHPAAEIFPLMSGTEFDGLVQDIKDNGLREPVVLHDGLILDGRNRYRACEAAGIDPIFREWDGEGSPEAYVVSKNLHRRHLDERERALVSAKLANLKPGHVASQKSAGEISPPYSVAEAAALMNVSTDLVKAAKVVINHGTPEEIAAVEQGKAAVSTTAKKIRERRASLDVAPVAETLAAPKPNNQGVKIPDGQTMESLCREGLRMQEQGMSIADVTKALGIGITTFPPMRDIVLLADRTDLSERDAKLARDALASMNETRQTIAAFNMNEPLALRVWGSQRQRQGSKPDQAEANRHSAFERAYGLITSACECCDQVDVPQLSRERVAEIAAELKTASEAVKRLRQRIMEIHQ